MTENPECKEILFDCRVDDGCPRSRAASGESGRPQTDDEVAFVREEVKK